MQGVWWRQGAAWIYGTTASTRPDNKQILPQPSTQPTRGSRPVASTTSTCPASTSGWSGRNRARCAAGACTLRSWHSTQLFPLLQMNPCPTTSRRTMAAPRLRCHTGGDVSTSGALPYAGSPPPSPRPAPVLLFLLNVPSYLSGAPCALIACCSRPSPVSWSSLCFCTL